MKTVIKKLTEKVGKLLPHVDRVVMPFNKVDGRIYGFSSEFYESKYNI